MKLSSYNFAQTKCIDIACDLHDLINLEGETDLVF